MAVTQYMILFTYDRDSMEIEVEKCLAAGWSLVGSLVVEPGSGYYREMLKTESKKSIELHGQV